MPEAPARTKINKAAPELDGGSYPPKRCVGDTVRVSADIFRDGHEMLRAVVRYKAPGGRRWLETPMHAVDAHHRGVRWEGEFTVETPGRWQFSIEAWNDLFATWRDEMHRKIDAGQHDLQGELSEGVALLEQTAAGAKDPADREAIEAAMAVMGDAELPRGRAPRGGHEPRPGGGGRAHWPAPRGDDAQAAAAAGGRPRAWALLRLVRAVPALVGRLYGRGGADPHDRRPRLRRPLLHTRPPDRPQEPQGPQQHARGRAGRPRRAVRHRVRRGRPRGGSPGAGDDRRPALAVRHRARARHGRGARPRAQRVGRPPVADRAPRVVPAAPRRHDQVRREPAQEVPGHLQLQLGHAGLASSCGRRGSRSCWGGSTSA